MFGWIITGGLLLRERAQEIESGYRKEDGQSESKVPMFQWIVTAFGAVAFIVILFG